MDCSEGNDKKEKYLPVKKIEFEDEADTKKYIMWENKSNICWLDASMALVAHNRTMKNFTGVSPQSYMSKIISAYDDAIRILNNSERNINLARKKLTHIQERTLNYLQPILKYKTGDPESAFCSLYNLLIQDPVVKKFLEVTWLSVKECTDCGKNSESSKSKPIITLSKIHSFDPENLNVLFRCNCNKSEQKMKLLYVSLPACLIFHFENGAGNEKPPLSFTTQRREYHLTGIMTLEKSQDSTVNHFITWVRDPSVDKWLDCNDLNLDVVYFSPDFPDINIKDVYMYVYEAFDDLGTITDSKIIKDKKSEETIPCFNLSDNSDDEISNSEISATESNKDTGKNESLKPYLRSSTIKIDRNASLRKTLTTDESAIKKSNQHADCTEHFKNITDNMGCVITSEDQVKPKEVDENKIPDENIITHKEEVLKAVNSGSNFISTAGNCSKEIGKDIHQSDFSANDNDITEKNKEEVLKAVNSGSNFISTAGNCSKEIGKDIHQSDFSANDNDITEKINENSCLLPGFKDDFITPHYRPTGFATKDSLSAENEPSFKNKKKSKTTSKNIKNNEVLSRVVSPNTSQATIPKNLKNMKIRDLLQLNCIDKTNVKKDYANNSEQISIAEPRENKSALNTSKQQENLSGLFLRDAGASSSGTSYVKLVQKKKIPCDLINKTNSENAAVNLDLCAALDDNTDVAIPSTSTSLRKRVDDDDDVPPSEKSKKRSNGGKDSVNSGKKMKDIQNSQKKSHVKSKLNNTSERTRGNNSGSNDSPGSHSGPGLITGAAGNSFNDATLLRNFGILSCHEAGCNCESADNDEILEQSVDFVFAYFCKLSEEYQRLNK